MLDIALAHLVFPYFIVHRTKILHHEQRIIIRLNIIYYGLSDEQDQIRHDMLYYRPRKINTVLDIKDNSTPDILELFLCIG